MKELNLRLMQNQKDKLSYENEAQELLKELRSIFNDHRETVQGVLDLVIDSEEDVRELLSYIRIESNSPDDVHDYAMDLYDEF